MSILSKTAELIETISYIYRNRADVKRLVKAEVRRTQDNLREAESKHLNLCLTHQQEKNRSHYAEHNCCYCKLEKEILRLTETVATEEPNNCSTRSEKV